MGSEEGNATLPEAGKPASNTIFLPSIGGQG